MTSYAYARSEIGAFHAHAYAPVGLPPVYDVVRDDGAIVTPDQYGFETDNDARARADTQEYIWNEIWKRRIVYFATVAATVWLFAYPLLRSAPKSDEYSSPIRWVSDLIRIVGGFLPGFAETWINGFARSPVQFVALLALVAGLLWLGARIASRISDRMGAIWRGIPVAPPGLPNNWIYRLRSNPYYIALHEGVKRKWAPAFFALLFVYLGITFASLLHPGHPLLLAISDLILEQNGKICQRRSSDFCGGQKSPNQEFHRFELRHALSLPRSDEVR